MGNVTRFLDDMRQKEAFVAPGESFGDLMTETFIGVVVIQLLASIARWPEGDPVQGH